MDNVDPYMTSLLVGLALPWVHAMLDQPWWTPTKRRLLVLASAAVLSVIVWWQSAYPMTWQQVTAQFAVIAGCAQTAFTILKVVKVNGVSLIDWAGLLTPGGEAYTPKHKADEGEDSGGD